MSDSEPSRVEGPAPSERQRVEGRAATIRQVLLGLLLVAGLWWLVTLVTGGFYFEAGPVRLSSRTPWRPLALALFAAILLWRTSGLRAVDKEVDALNQALERVAPAAAVAAAAAAFAAGVVWNTRTAGGSDSYCYIGQAETFVLGTSVLDDPLAKEVGWPNAAVAFAPVGWVPSAARPPAAAPLCPPGLSLLMAAAWMIGGREAIHVVVPVAGAVLVWLTFVLGRSIGGPLAGLMASALVAASPIVLYQLVQPMSDVPAAALWLAALVLCTRHSRASSLIAGIVTGLAVLVRPNLAPLAAAPAALLAFDPVVSRTSWRSRGFRIVLFAAGVIPCVGFLAWLNSTRYGSPLSTGYGDAGGLFAIANVWPNLQRYPRWLIEAHTPLVGLALVSPLLGRLRGDREWRPTRVWILLAFAGAVIVSYLAYTVFDAWWYIRFLLPAIPVLLALASASAVTIVSRICGAWRGPAVVAGVTVLVLLYVGTARSREAFALARFERRYRTAGEYARASLPPEATVITIQESGSVRHYAGRSAILWDALEPHRLDAAIRDLQALGRPPFLMLEDAEEPLFRERFAGQVFGALDWPPRAVVAEQVVVRVYDPEDRARFRNGQRIATETVAAVGGHP